MLRVILFQLIFSLPATPTPEALHDREARTHIIADAIATASETLTCYRQNECKRVWSGSAQELSMVLTTIAWHESHFDRNLHAGECKPHQCDPYHDKERKLRFKSVSMWQIQQNAAVPEKIWSRLAGTDEESTRLAALTAGRIAARSRGMCTYQHRNKDWAHMTFAAYGTGSICFKESAKLRVATFHRFSRKAEAIKAQLRAEGAA